MQVPNVNQFQVTFFSKVEFRFVSLFVDEEDGNGYFFPGFVVKVEGEDEDELWNLMFILLLE